MGWYIELGWVAKMKSLKDKVSWENNADIAYDDGYIKLAGAEENQYSDIISH